jgi:hypothetical protein
MPVKTEKKVDNLHVTSIEEVIYLLQEWEKDYSEKGWMDAREAYVKGLEYFANLK